MTTHVDLDAIRKALADATPGPWEAVHARYGYDVEETWAVDPVGPSLTNICHVTDGQSDAYLIANAPTWLADLLAEVERLRAFDPCHGGDEQYARHLDVCVPWYEHRDTINAGGDE